MNAYPNISYIASLIGEPARAAVLQTLLDGRALPAGELARIAGVSPQTISSHLAKLVEGNLLTSETHGRHRYYRLADPEVAQVLERLSALAPPVQIKSLRQSDQHRKVRYARTCYDHLAGELGVAVTKVLVERGWLEPGDELQYQITKEGEAWCREFGIEVGAIQKGRRYLAKQCLDWSERRYHLAGALGAAFTSRLFELQWIVRDETSRAVQVTELGKTQFFKEFGVKIEWHAFGAGN